MMAMQLKTLARRWVVYLLLRLAGALTALAGRMLPPR
jgi:hypothetical protein